MKIRIFKQKDRDVMEIKDRNTEQHWEGSSVNTEIIYPTPKGEGGGNGLH